MTRILMVAYPVLSAVLCLAQTATTRPAFEAAAIKPSKAADTGTHWNSTKGRMTMDNLSVKQIIATAYGVREFQVSGPAWIGAERYHIDAKADGKADDDIMLPMLQTLLAERFQVVLHREKKEMAAYALVVAKGGMKIHAVEGEGSQSRGSGGKLTAKHVSMAKFAELLSRQLDRPVADETNTGSDGFDFTLEYANERLQRAAEADGVAAPGPSIFTALPEQLGLKLEARKAAVEILVVDKVERPTEN